MGQITRTLTGGCVLIVALLLLPTLTTFAQRLLPVIRATSKTVDILDGNHLKKGYWAIMPERKPDYYFVEIPQKNNRVTFITDQDSISFETVYGKDYDFIILLNGKDSCFTRISARYRNLVPFTRKKTGAGLDTIPFRLGDNSKIYLKGSLNGSQPLDIQLDLGAGGSVIKKASIDKVKMNFDQTTTLHNTDGSNKVPFSSRNLLQIGDLAWDSVSIAVADNMTHREDLIVGNSLFRDKILEIDYDKMILVIHDTVPGHSASYSRQDLVLDGGVIPFIEASLTKGGQTQKGWVMFDTGAYTTILNSQDVPIPYRILGELTQMAGSSSKRFIPKLSIADQEFSGFNYNVQDMGKNGLHMILGNDLLKRFNTILDNRSGYLYLKANSLAQLPYGRRGEYYLVMIAVAAFLLTALIVLFIRMRKKSLRTRLKS